MIAENPTPNMPPYTVNAELGVKAQIPEVTKQSRSNLKDFSQPSQENNVAAKQTTGPEEQTKPQVEQVAEMVGNITEIGDLILAAEKIVKSGNLRAAEKIELVDIIDAKFAQITQDMLSAVAKKVPEITTIEQLTAATWDVTKSPKGLSPKEAMFNRQYSTMKSNLEHYRQSLQAALNST